MKVVRALCLLVIALALPSQAVSDAACESRCDDVYVQWAEQCFAVECHEAALCQYDICIGGCAGGITQTPASCPQN